MDPLVDLLRQKLSADRELFLDSWIDQTRRRCWRLRRHPDLCAELRGRCEGVLQALAQTLDGCTELAVGAPEFKEPLKWLAFVAGWLAGVDLPVGTGLALCHGLEAVFGAGRHTFFQSLEVVVAEAYLAGEREKAQARHRHIIRKSQLVSMLGEGLAAVFLVGDPDREALQDAIGRLMMLSLMREARRLLLDVSAASVPTDLAVLALELLAGHRDGLSGRKLQVVLTGMAEEQARAVIAVSRLPCLHFDDLEQCLRGLDLVQRER